MELAHHQAAGARGRAPVDGPAIVAVFPLAQAEELAVAAQPIAGADAALAAAVGPTPAPGGYNDVAGGGGVA
ncbi:MAG: hypothetical protein R3B06_13000 [Kofleriaceae bacterium]